ncbi:MAG: hypothetical protein KDK78_07970, partial [Chlamydiia bacterium]|nr:hypothetical protein [Chlamydiia bacterium]
NRRALSRDIWSRFFETLCPSRPFKLLSLRCTLPDVEELFCDDLSKGEGLVDLGGFHSYLKANPPIQQLDLSGLRMRQPDAEKLIEALKEAVQIQDLRLNTNVQPAVYSKDLLVAFARERGILKLPPCSSNFPDSPHRSTRIPLPKKHVDYEPDQMACAAFMISLGGPGDRYELMGVEGCAQRFLEEGIGVRDGTNYRERVCDAVIEAMLEIRKGEYKAVGGELLNIVRKSLRKYEVPEDVLLEMLENAYGPAVWSTWREITKLLKESVAS